MQIAGDGDHVVKIIPFCESRPQKNAADMDVEGDVALLEVAYRDSEVPLQDLNGHRGLLLADARERLQAALQFPCAGTIRPDPARIAGVLLHDQLAGGAKPARYGVDISVQGNRFAAVHSLSNRGQVSCDASWIQVAEPLLEQIGSFPGTLGGYSLVEDHSYEERERVIADQRIRRFVAAKRRGNRGLL
jgi:hypothetical protein